MFLRYLPTNDLIEVLDLPDVINPFMQTVHGKLQSGEDTTDIDDFNKSQLTFPSGETLPLCWTDAHYRDHLLKPDSFLD